MTEKFSTDATLTRPATIDTPPAADAKTETTSPVFQQVAQERCRVTMRSLFLGVLLAAGMAALNCWVQTRHNVYFLGGAQMPFGAIFGIVFLLFVVNVPLRVMHRFMPWSTRLFPPLSAVELLTVYSMMVFAALISTPGTDNFFLTTGPALFYFATPENGWADLFYQHMPPWFAPGWDGKTYQREVIEQLYQGGLTVDQIPWHAWTLVLVAWSIFLLLVYSTLFFVALLLRRQWITNESLSFPLTQLPLQMVEHTGEGSPPAGVFWKNPVMWSGGILAATLHFFLGMNSYFPDWPFIAGFQTGSVQLRLTERPWSAAEAIGAEFFLGAIGIAYLLTREVSLSFWLFFLLFKLQMVFAEQVGFSVGALPRDSYMGRPTFIAFQGVGAWLMMAGLLIWTARHVLWNLAREAFSSNRSQEGEPFSPRFVVLGFIACFVALLTWCWYAGIPVLLALTFLGLYLLISLVLTRLVIEGGFIFPQVTFSGVELMTTGLLGSSAIGAASLAKLSFVQPVLLSDMRSNILPAFMHTLKIADSLQLDRRALRRLLGGILVAIAVSSAITLFVCIATLYSAGGLTTYTWFSQAGPRSVFNGAATVIKTQPGVDPNNVLWMGVGAAVVMALTVARSRFLWFPLHPLGYLIAPGYPISRLWFSFFLGWAIKTLIMRFGGGDTYLRVRPFMIGLILGNLCAMVFWMCVGFFKGTQIQYWPA
jgi:hypothetical protein